MQNEKSFRSLIQAFLYLLPMLVIITIFNIYPIFKSLIMAFYKNYDIFSGSYEALSLVNFETLFKDPSFYLALKNTFIYVLVVTPVSVILSLLLAIGINSIGFLQRFFQSIYFLPFVTSTVAISIVWQWLYNSDYGLMNYFLSLVGVHPIAWLEDPKWAMLAVIIMSIWRSLGFNILILLVGLNNINQNYIKASQVDGANEWQRLINIIIPLLGPSLFFVSMNAMISNFKVFDEIFAMFNGLPGPADSAMTIVFYLYRKFYVEYDYGVASSAGIVLFVIIMTLTLIQLSINKKFVFYQ